MCYQLSQIKYFSSYAPIFSQSIDANIVMIYRELLELYCFISWRCGVVKRQKLDLQISSRRACLYTEAKQVLKFRNQLQHSVDCVGYPGTRRVLDYPYPGTFLYPFQALIIRKYRPEFRPLKENTLLTIIGWEKGEDKIRWIAHIVYLCQN